MLTTPAKDNAPTPLPRAIAIAAALTVLVAVLVLAFTWPAATSAPRNINVAIVGPQPVVALLQNQLPEPAREMLNISTLGSREEAIAAIESREIQGAIILGAAPELLSASANGAINQAIAQMATAMPQNLAGGAQLTVTDVVPYSVDDPAGGLLTSSSFPLLFGGILGGVLISTLIRGTSRRLVAVAVYALVSGVVVAAIFQPWFGALQGDFLSNALALALSIASITTPIIGLVSLIGPGGIAVGAVTMMLIANPISGAGLPAQFLPGAWGVVGQWFPPGAAATLIRELSYFPAADKTFPWLILLGWVALGVVLSALAPRQRAAA